MRAQTLIYDFFRGHVSVKLIVSARRSVVVSVVAGNRVFRKTYFDDVDVDGDRIRVGEAVFSPDTVLCDLSVQGVRVRADARIYASTAFRRPLGLLCAMGLSDYSVSCPAVTAALSGRATVGDTIFLSRDPVVVSSTEGRADQRHTFITGADRESGLYLACGDNATWGKLWSYAVACVVRSGRTHIFTGATKLVRLTDGADLFRAEIASPGKRLTIDMRDGTESCDSGVRYYVCAEAQAALTIGTRVEKFALPATYLHLGAARVADEEGEQARLGAAVAGRFDPKDTPPQN